MLSHMANLPPGDPKLVESIVSHLKSQGMFDQFRKDCLADVDTKPAYQNLRQRVEGYVSNFLGQQQWRPDLNKNQLRDSLRRHINECDMLEKGVDRVVEQVVNPRVYRVFFPQIEAVVFQLLGKELPSNKAGQFAGPQLVSQIPAATNVTPGQAKSSSVSENQKTTTQPPQQNSSQASGEIKGNIHIKSEGNSPNQLNTVETQTDAPSVVAEFKEKKVMEDKKDDNKAQTAIEKVSIKSEVTGSENSNDGSTTPVIQEPRPKPESPPSHKTAVKDVKSEDTNEKKDKIKIEQSPKKSVDSQKGKTDQPIKKSEVKSDSKHKTHSAEKTKNISSDNKNKTDAESRKSSSDGKVKVSDSSSKSGKLHHKLSDKPEKEKVRSLSGSSSSPKIQKSTEERSKSSDRIKSGEKGKQEQSESTKGKNVDHKTKHLSSKKDEKSRHNSSESSSKVEKHKTSDPSKVEKHKEENKSKSSEKSRPLDSKSHDKSTSSKSSDDSKLKHHKSKSDKPSSSSHSDKTKSTDLKPKSSSSDKHKPLDHQKKEKERSSSISKSDKLTDSTKHHSADRDKKGSDSSKSKISDKELGKNSGDKHKNEKNKSKSSEHKHKPTHDKYSSEKGKSEHRSKHSESPRSKDSSSSSSRHSSSTSKHKTESAEKKNDEVKGKSVGNESKKPKEEKKDHHKTSEKIIEKSKRKQEKTEQKPSSDKGNSNDHCEKNKQDSSDNKANTSTTSVTAISKASSDNESQSSAKELPMHKESESKEAKTNQNEGSLIKSRHSYIPEVIEEEKVEVKETSDVSSPEQMHIDKKSPNQESSSVLPEEVPENPEGNEADDTKSVGGWSDVTVSSVHTSDLSDYDDHITITDSDSEFKPSPEKEARKALKGKTPSPNKYDRRKDNKARTPKRRGRLPKRNLELTPSELKTPEQPISEIKPPEDKTPDSEKVSPKEEEGEPRRELRRQRKINPRYMSDEFASIFSKGKDWLQSLDDESLEKEKPKKEEKEEQEYKPHRSKRTSSTASIGNASIHDIELIHSPRSDTSEMETRSQRRRSGDTSLRPLSPKSDVSADSYHSHHQRPFTPESTGSGDTSRRRPRQSDTPTSSKQTPTARRGRRERQSDQHASQRYDDSDLYKPRPVITASTRRSRASTPPLVPDVSVASGKRYPESSPIDTSPISRTAQKSGSDALDTSTLEKHNLSEESLEKAQIETREKDEHFHETETRRGRPRKSESSSIEDSAKKRRSPSPALSESEKPVAKRTRTPSSESNPRRLRGMKGDVISGAPKKRHSLKEESKAEPSVTTRGRLRRDSTENTPNTRAHKRPSETPKQSSAKRRR